MTNSREEVNIVTTKYIFVMKNVHHHDFKDTDGVEILCRFPDCIRRTIQFLIMRVLNSYLTRFYFGE